MSVIRKIVLVGLLAAGSVAHAQDTLPANVGEVVRFDPEKPFRGLSFVGYGCKEDFTICAHAWRKGSTFYVFKTAPINFRPGRPSNGERIVGVTRHVMANRETTGWYCDIDGQSPLIVFASPNRQTVRAVLLDRSGNIVEVVRALRQPNWCEFGAGD